MLELPGRIQVELPGRIQVEAGLRQEKGRYLSIVFERKLKGIVRPITGWDMSRADI